MLYGPYKRSLLLAAGILLAGLLSPRPALAQAPAPKTEAAEPAVEEVVRVDTTLIACDVMVMDKDGRPVKGLAQSDFMVAEDEEPQIISTFGMGDDVGRQRSIVLIIDYSSSMLPYLITSIDAAKTLVDSLAAEDRMAIVTDDVETLIDFTQDKAKLKSKLDDLKRKATAKGKLGRSEQYSALMETLKKMTSRETLRPIIIFQTDGDELSLLKPSDADSAPPWSSYFRPPIRREFSMADVLASAQKARVTLYSVIPGVKFTGFPPDQRVERAKVMTERNITALNRLGSPMAEAVNFFLKKKLTPEQVRRTSELHLYQQTALEGVAKVTGGWADYLEKPDEAASVYARIFKDINQRYIIGYQPTNKERDGSLRKIHIEVKGHPDYVVWGRKSYYAPLK